MQKKVDGKMRNLVQEVVVTQKQGLFVAGPPDCQCCAVGLSRTVYAMAILKKQSGTASQRLSRKQKANVF